MLQKFIGHPEMKPLAANSPEALVKHIKWASTAVLKSASSPAAAGTDHPDASPAAAGTPAGVPVPAQPHCRVNNRFDDWHGPAQAANAPAGSDPADNQKTVDDVW
ncbi:MAG: hypothetical protein WKF30_08290 [Pyrinomonadaceae bacterium]